MLFGGSYSNSHSVGTTASYDAPNVALVGGADDSIGGGCGMSSTNGFHPPSRLETVLSLAILGLMQVRGDQPKTARITTGVITKVG